MNQIIKEHLISASQTFIATFLTIAGTTLAHGQIEWTTAFWFSIVLIAARGALKEVISRTLPTTLGGRSK